MGQIKSKFPSTDDNNEWCIQPVPQSHSHIEDTLEPGADIVIRTCNDKFRCGSPSKNTTNAAHPLSTENASKLYIFYYCIVFNLLFMLFDPNFIFMFYSNIPKMNKLYVKPINVLLLAK